MLLTAINKIMYKNFKIQKLITSKKKNLRQT